MRAASASAASCAAELKLIAVPRAAAIAPKRTRVRRLEAPIFLKKSRTKKPVRPSVIRVAIHGDSDPIDPAMTRKPMMANHILRDDFGFDGVWGGACATIGCGTKIC